MVTQIRLLLCPVLHDSGGHLPRFLGASFNHRNLNRPARGFERAAILYTTHSPPQGGEHGPGNDLSLTCGHARFCRAKMFSRSSRFRSTLRMRAWTNFRKPSLLPRKLQLVTCSSPSIFISVPRVVALRSRGARGHSRSAVPVRWCRAKIGKSSGSNPLEHSTLTSQPELLATRESRREKINETCG